MPRRRRDQSDEELSSRLRRHLSRPLRARDASQRQQDSDDSDESTDATHYPKSNEIRGIRLGDYFLLQDLVPQRVNQHQDQERVCLQTDYRTIFTEISRTMVNWNATILPEFDLKDMDSQWGSDFEIPYPTPNLPPFPEEHPMLDLDMDLEKGGQGDSQMHRPNHHTSWTALLDSAACAVAVMSATGLNQLALKEAPDIQGLLNPDHGPLAALFLRGNANHSGHLGQYSQYFALIAAYCASSGILYHRQEDTRRKDVLLVIGVGTGAVAGYLKGLDAQSIILGVLPGCALAAIALSWLCCIFASVYCRIVGLLVAGAAQPDHQLKGQGQGKQAICH